MGEFCVAWEASPTAPFWMVSPVPSTNLTTAPGWIVRVLLTAPAPLPIRIAGKLVRVPAPVVMVSEAGASVYSASENAIREFPRLDITVRGAISIARRLQEKALAWRKPST